MFHNSLPQRPNPPTPPLEFFSLWPVPFFLHKFPSADLVLSDSLCVKPELKPHLPPPPQKQYRSSRGARFGSRPTALQVNYFPPKQYPGPSRHKGWVPVWQDAFFDEPTGHPFPPFFPLWPTDVTSFAASHPPLPPASTKQESAFAFPDQP